MAIVWNKAKTQIVYVGILAFCGPGMFNAVTSLGSPGGSSASIMSAALATLYACFAVFGYFGGAFFNIFGNKILMIVGGATYGFYVAGIYGASKITSGANVWLAVVSGMLCGVGAGWFWTSQGAMMMSYPVAEERGKFIGIFWMLFNLGGVAGGIIAFVLNWNATQGEPSPASYFSMVGIMLLGAFGALFLAPSGKVERADGSLVAFSVSADAKGEFLGAMKVACNKHMILLFPMFIASNWFYPYQFEGVNNALFTIRTRGFNSAFYWGSQMLGSVIIGKILDRKGVSRYRRALQGFVLACTMFNFTYVLGAVLQHAWFGYIWDRSWNHETQAWNPAFADENLIDFTESRRAAFPMIVFFLYGLSDAMLQAFAYWVMGAIAGDDTSLSARFAGYYKGVQSLGACFSWAIMLKVQFLPQFWLAWALMGLAFPLIFITIRDLKDDESLANDASEVKRGVEENVATTEPTKAL